MDNIHKEDHLIPLAGLAVGALANPAAAKETVQKVLSTGKGVIKSLGGYKISPGQHHRKLAAAINYLSSLGYSTKQMQQPPLSDYIILIGSFGEAIKDVIKAGFFQNGNGMLSKIVPNAPAPAGNRSSYSTPPDGSALDPIVRKVFPGVGGFGVKLTSDDLYRALPPQTAAEQPQSFNDKTQALIDTGISKIAVPTGLSGKGIDRDDSTLLIPLLPVMNSSLRNAGFVPPANDLDGTAMLFYQKIVQPAQKNNYDADYLDDAIVNAILSFVGTLAEKQRNGETLNNKVYDVIATGANKVADTVEQKAVETGQFKLGEFISKNIVWIIAGALALGVLIFFVARKK